MTKCDSCGAELKIGDYPFCPHGSTRVHVDAFEGYWDDNLAADPVWFTSARQRRQIMDERGFDYLEDKDRNTPKQRSSGRALFFDMKR